MPRRSREDRLFKLNVRLKGGRKLLSLAGRPFVRLLRFDRLRGFYLDVLQDRDALEKGLHVLNVTHEVPDECLARIPKEGPVIAVSNHPFGGIEPLVLATVLRTVREDVRVAADRLLRRAPEVEDALILPDPLGKRGRPGSSMPECIEWVKQGGMLALFPARQVSHIDFKRRAIADPKWRRTIAHIVRETGAPVLPIFFSGCNGAVFQFLGLIHYKLSHAVLPRQILRRRPRHVRLCVGSPIPPKKLAALESDKDLTAYLRMRTYLLDNRSMPRASAERSSHAARARRRAFEDIAPPVDPDIVSEEVRRLPPENTLAEVNQFAAILARADEIPHLIQEIGRLREITFRAANEGTGKSLDLDEFDAYYHHLFIWNRETEELVGAYRLGLTNEILEQFGEDGLYTSTLFRFKPGMLERINPAIELGRSFVRPEYQRNYAPLMLLWKGIGEFVLRRKKYRYLFGPVSINDDYNSTSRQLMIRFLEQNKYRRELARLVKAKTPLKPKVITGWDRESRRRLVQDINELSDLIADIEADRKGVPILLKQYLKLGGRLLGCNIDPDFSNVLDVLLLLDLTEADPKVLARYMGKERAEEFLAYHRGTPEAAARSAR